MRALVGVDLQATGHEWLVERAALYAERIGAPLDLVYFLSGAAEGVDHRVRLASLMPDVPPERKGIARIEPANPEDGFVHLSNEYDVIVVGSREPAMLERLLHGPMASRILRQARCSVLVPRGERPAAQAPRLLVGVDVEGPAPTRVLAWANRWAAWLGGSVHIVYAAAAHRGDWLGVKDTLRSRLENMLAAHIEEPYRGTVQVRRGEPEDTLVQMSQDFDLLLVGNREREGLAKFILGTVAASVVRRAACDVISLPTTTTDPPAA